MDSPCGVRVQKTLMTDKPPAKDPNHVYHRLTLANEVHLLWLCLTNRAIRHAPDKRKAYYEYRLAQVWMKHY